MLKVLEHILMSRPVERPEHTAYSDAVKELQADGMYELQRLATKMPDQLLVLIFSQEVFLQTTLTTSRTSTTSSRLKSMRSSLREH